MESVGDILLSSNEQQIFEIIRQVDNSTLDHKTACEVLEICERTLFRYLKRYRAKGLLFLKHGNRGKKPINAHPYEMKAAAIKAMREILFDFNMTHAREVIEEKFNLKIPRETFRRWCHAGDIVKHRNKRRSKPRYKRTRKTQQGLMVQFDGSFHKWFGDEETCLIAGIDDATSTLLEPEFFKSENTPDCMQVLRNIIEKNGVFRVLYVDQAGLYGGIKRSGFSQITRALRELGISVIYAQSPEGKGRIERVFRTLQDRLIPELRLNQIKTIEVANKYLRSVYVPDHNRRFSVEPENPEKAFLSVDSKVDLKDVFCLKETRTVSPDHTISLKAERWKVRHPGGLSIARRRIELRIYQNEVAAFFLNEKLILEKILSDRSTDKVAG
jgi:transposase